MRKSIIIKHPLQDSGEMASVPLQYEITKEGNRTTLHCKIPEGKKPDWLTLTEFSIPSIYMPGNPGVTGTYFSEVKCGNVETALFLDSVYKQIRLAEKWSEIHS
jgi:hypothetical protein